MSMMSGMDPNAAAAASLGGPSAAPASPMGGVGGGGGADPFPEPGPEDRDLPIPPNDPAPWLTNSMAYDLMGAISVTIANRAGYTGVNESHLAKAETIFDSIRKAKKGQGVREPVTEAGAQPGMAGPPSPAGPPGSLSGGPPGTVGAGGIASSP